MRVYLDNCAFNRPFDDQSQLRVRLETEAKLYLQAAIRDGKVELVWSYILQFENEANPFADRKFAIDKWRAMASEEVVESPGLLARAKELAQKGMKSKDALHVASAVEGACDLFITTDDKIIKRLSDLTEVRVASPTEIIGLIDEYDK